MAASDALPVVDLAPFFTEDVKGGTAGATEAVRQACQTHGFFRAVNHGVPVDLMARALELSAAFFALPDRRRPRSGRPRGPRCLSQPVTDGSRRTRPTRTSTWWSLIPSSGSTRTPLSLQDSGQFSNAKSRRPC